MEEIQSFCIRAPCVCQLGGVTYLPNSVWRPDRNFALLSADLSIQVFRGCCFFYSNSGAEIDMRD